MLYTCGFGLAGSPLTKEALFEGFHADGFTAALLGFSVRGLSSLGSFVVGLAYNQTIASIAIVILLMSLIALIVYKAL